MSIAIGKTSSETARPPSESWKASPCIMIFDLSIRGHHAAYIKHLIQSWIAAEQVGELVLVVSPRFLQVHADVVELASASPSHSIRFLAISNEEEANLNARKSRLDRVLRNLREWRLLQKYTRSLAPTHCLLMYLDTCELPLLLGFGLSTPFSGIYFRPTFHYSDLGQYRPSWKERVQQAREKAFIHRLLHHPKLKTVFCLDTFSVKYLNAGVKQPVAVALPDPVEPIQIAAAELEEFRSSLDLDLGRQVFLLFGSFEAQRKGVYQLLEALELLPTDLSQKICILLVGSAVAEEQARIQARIQQVCSHQPVQIKTRFEFISDRDVEKYFLVTDVALAIYQRHVGMSGILLLAAAARKPVLSSNYGLMGELVKRHNLGLSIDSTVPQEIAAGLTKFLQTPIHSLADPVAMKIFAEQHSAQLFAQTIFHHVLH